MNSYRLGLLLLLFCALFPVFCKRQEPKYQGPRIEWELFWKIDHFVTSYESPQELELINIGNFNVNLDTENYLVGVWVRKCTPQTLEDGRTYAIQFVQQYYQLLQESAQTQEYIDGVHKSYPEKYPFDKLVPQYAGVKIAYWDSSSNRPPLPYLAEITFTDGKFRYYQADPETQALCLVLEESYDTAQGIAGLEKVKNG